MISLKSGQYRTARNSVCRRQNQGTNTSLKESQKIFGRHCAKRQRFYGTNFLENTELMRDSPPLPVFIKTGFEARYYLHVLMSVKS